MSSWVRHAIGEAPYRVVGQIRMFAYVNVYRPPSVKRRPELTTTTHAFAPHCSPALFLQTATQFATIGAMLFPSQPIRLDAEDKLAALRRLDKGRAWNSLDDQLYCTICKNVISGSQIEVVGGTNGLRALRIKCSTPGCFSTPADWILPVKSDAVREIDILFRDNDASPRTYRRVID
jgi:hypothetical protein